MSSVRAASTPWFSAASGIPASPNTLPSPQVSPRSGQPRLRSSLRRPPARARVDNAYDRLDDARSDGCKPQQQRRPYLPGQCRTWTHLERFHARSRAALAPTTPTMVPLALSETALRAVAIGIFLMRRSSFVRRGAIVCSEHRPIVLRTTIDSCFFEVSGMVAVVWRRI